MLTDSLQFIQYLLIFRYYYIINKGIENKTNYTKTNKNMEDKNMKRLSELMENMENAVANLKNGYSEEQWANKQQTDYMHIHNALCELGTFENNRDLEEIEYDVEPDEDKLRELYTQVEIALEDYEYEYEPYMDGASFYDLLLYYTNKVHM